jgi:2-keto-4-pentenoate hydratase/2-oxohepta-3-ene-1,7-dioic acid hydratase in catechol pathway
MKYVRFKKDEMVQQGILEGDVIHSIKNNPYDAPVQIESQLNVRDVTILSPITPSKIIAVGLNYSDHAKELNLDPPREPLIFLKPPSSVIGPYENIYYPKQTKRVDYEAELALVIKKEAYNVSYDEAEKYIFGYTCLNDVTARDLQKKDGQWTRAKSFDTFCPIGPYVETDIDVSSLKIELLVNNKIKQSSNTSKMIFDCKRLVEFISGIMTLKPGDAIATGTPAGVGPVKVGDEIEVRIEKIGSLVNRVGRR